MFDPLQYSLTQTTTMKTIKEKAAAAMDCKNWTNYSLAQLIDAGRISKSDSKTIEDFIRAALGEVQNLEELKERKEIVKFIQEIA